MGAKYTASRLSDGKYGYDFVVATTQASINGTMMSFLNSEGGRDVTVYYIMGDDGEIYVPIAADELKARAGKNYVDPLEIPDQTDFQDERVQALYRAHFVGAFRAIIGLPYTDRLDLLPNIITLNQDASKVLFRGMCSDFKVVALQGVLYGSSPQWISKSQPPENPWTFTANVDLTTLVTSDQDIQHLPLDVQAKISELHAKTGVQFDIQSLLLSLTSATKHSDAFIDGLEKNSPIRAILEDAFQEAYIKALTKHGDPLIGCMAVAKKSSSPSTGSHLLTDVHHMVNTYVGEDGLDLVEPPEAAVKCTTLNYLCSWDGHILPPPHKFSWNWVKMLDPGQVADHDGVIAINRTWLAQYFARALQDSVATQCLLLDVQCDRDGGSVHYSGEFPGYQSTPAKFSSAPDPKVLSFQYKIKDQDQCGLRGCLGQLEVRYEYGMNLSFSGHIITVEQTQLLHVFLQRNTTKKSGDYVKKTMTDTFSVTVDGQTGRLIAAPVTQGQLVDKAAGIPNDHSIANSAEIRSIVNKMNKVAPLMSVSLNKIVLSTIQDFVFPCGNVFMYKMAEFSDYQDLLCQITYTEPGWKVVRVPQRLSRPHVSGRGKQRHCC